MKNKNVWLERISDSIPEHAADVKDNLVTVMNNDRLSEVDTNACAFAAAISSGNGELAFEISMASCLAGSPEREAVKTACALMGMTNIYYPFVEMSGDDELSKLTSGLKTASYTTYGGVTKKQFEMYTLTASIAGQCRYCVNHHYQSLKKAGMSVEDLQLIGQIAAVISAIGKVAY